MNRIIILGLIACGVAFGRARTSGYCEQGGQVTVTGGISSVTKVQQSYPQCTITVYLAGTLTLATVYSDNSGTAKANPFTASTAGYWFWYANNGTYDVKMSGGGISVPFTWGAIGVLDPASVLTTINVATGYGVIADGTGPTGTDQVTKIQSAVDAAHVAGGGAIFFPWAPLCYTVGYPGIHIYSNITVYSDSQSTCIQVKAASYASWPGGWALFSNDSSVTGLQNSHIKNLTLDGNRANISGLSGANLNAFGVAVYGASNSSVEDVIVKNAGDGVYGDCSGASRLTQGNGFSVSGGLIVNSQRNGISIICGTNTRIINNEISTSNGASPQAGIDVEENTAGQAVPGLLIANNKVHNNTAVGIIVQPAHDAAGTFAAQLMGNQVYGNGQQGLLAINFTSLSNTISVVGDTYLNNTGTQAVVEAFNSPVLNMTAIGTSNVGMTIAQVTTNALISGYYSGGIYDLECDNLSTGVTSGVILAHGTVHGALFMTGSMFPGPIDPSTGNAFPLRAKAIIPDGLAVGNVNNIEVADGNLGAGASVTAQRGMNCEDLTIGTFNICSQMNVSAGSNKFNLDITGTAQNFLQSGFRSPPQNIAVIKALFPCNTGDNYGMTLAVNDAASNVFGSVITSGAPFYVGLAFCNGGDYVFH